MHISFKFFFFWHHNHICFSFTWLTCLLGAASHVHHFHGEWTEIEANRVYLIANHWSQQYALNRTQNKKRDTTKDTDIQYNKTIKILSLNVIISNVTMSFVPRFVLSTFHSCIFVMNSLSDEMILQIENLFSIVFSE